RCPESLSGFDTEIYVEHTHHVHGYVEAWFQALQGFVGDCCILEPLPWRCLSMMLRTDRPMAWSQFSEPDCPDVETNDRSADRRVADPRRGISQRTWRGA